jgi:hypothetical protein
VVQAAYNNQQIVALSIFKCYSELFYLSEIKYNDEITGFPINPKVKEKKNNNN